MAHALELKAALRLVGAEQRTGLADEVDAVETQVLAAGGIEVAYRAVLDLETVDRRRLRRAGAARQGGDGAVRPRLDSELRRGQDEVRKLDIAAQQAVRLTSPETVTTESFVDPRGSPIETSLIESQGCGRSRASIFPPIATLVPRCSESRDAIVARQSFQST